MNHSESVTKIATALLNVQEAVDHVAKNSRNPHFGNTYADLNAFLHAVREPLKDNAITMIQSPGMAEGWVTVETLLVHGSGEWIKGVAGSPLPKDDPQGVGSAITYLRRYSLASLLAIPQEDDDGNAASQPRSVNRPARPNTEGGALGTEFACPDCGGEMWDNRDDPKASMNGGKRPDFKCKDKQCDNAIWGHHPDEDLTGRIRALMDKVDLTVDQANRCEEAIESNDADAMARTLDWLRGKQVTDKVPATV